MNYSNRPLDIATAVEYVSNMLLISKGFYIMTDMGRIGIEGVHETDPVYPISIYKWNSQENTVWKSSQHNERADYYIQIGIHPEASQNYLKMLAMSAIMMAKFYHAVHHRVNHAYIDASVLSFISENERDPELYISEIQKEFMSLHYSLKPNKMAIELAHFMMKERISNAVKLMNKAESNFFAKAGDSQFNCDVLALIYDLRMAS